MSLETGTRIQDLVATNPVGATDFASQGDDHLRLIKACVQGSFPNLGATAVVAAAEELNILDGATLSTAELNTLDGIAASTAELNILEGATLSTAELNILDGATLSTAELNILDGVTLTAAQINDAALKTAANAFTASQTITTASGYAVTLNGASGAGTSFGLKVQAGTNASDTNLLLLNKAGTVTMFGIAGDGSGLWSPNGSNGFSMSAAGLITLAKPSSGSNSLIVGDGSADARVQLKNVNQYALVMNYGAGGGVILGAASSGANPGLAISDTNGAQLGALVTGLVIGSGPTGGDKGAGTINAQGAIYHNGVDIRSDAAVTSTSTTLVKGQLHHITGNATLPALDTGEWIAIVNNSGSPITITEHSGDTTYWTTANANISTVTLGARGRMIASGAGSSVVYVTGDITGAT